MRSLTIKSIVSEKELFEELKLLIADIDPDPAPFSSEEWRKIVHEAAYLGKREIIEQLTEILVEILIDRDYDIED